jgi:protocatechuate 3,4-dioxygenase beta subunit
MKQPADTADVVRRGWSRREVLRRLTGAAVVAALAVRGRGRWRGSERQAARAGAPGALGAPAAGRALAAVACVVRPEQTEGPYFVDEKLNRSDIRSDPATGALREGALLRLRMNVFRSDADACTPLAGVLVDVWHCDALGVYSDVRDMNFDTRGQKFLRGYQVTDGAGKVEFLTIYPGWYQGRTVHIHFKLRTDPAATRGFEFTSQLYFDDNLTDEVFRQPPYADKGERSTRNENDGIYRQGGDKLMLELSQDAQGHVGTFDVALQLEGGVPTVTPSPIATETSAPPTAPPTPGTEATPTTAPGTEAQPIFLPRVSRSS